MKLLLVLLVLFFSSSKGTAVVDSDACGLLFEDQATIPDGWKLGTTSKNSAWGSHFRCAANIGTTGFQAHASNPRECASLCNNHVGCVAFNFNFDCDSDPDTDFQECDSIFRDCENAQAKRCTYYTFDCGVNGGGTAAATQHYYQVSPTAEPTSAPVTPAPVPGIPNTTPAPVSGTTPAPASGSTPAPAPVSGTTPAPVSGSTPAPVPSSSTNSPTILPNSHSSPSSSSSNGLTTQQAILYVTIVLSVVFLIVRFQNARSRSKRVSPGDTP